MEVKLNEGTFRTIAEAAESLGVKRGAIYARAKRRGCTVQEALEAGPNVTKYAAEINGVRYSSISDFCEKTGIKYPRLYKKMKQKKGDLQSMIQEVKKAREAVFLRCYEQKNIILDISLVLHELSIYATVRNTGEKILVECNGGYREIIASSAEEFLSLVINAIATLTRQTINAVENELALLEVKREQYDPITGQTRITTRRI